MTKMRFRAELFGWKSTSLHPPTCSELGTDTGISQDDGINSINVQSDMRIGCNSSKLGGIMIRDALDHLSRWNQWRTARFVIIIQFVQNTAMLDERTLACHVFLDPRFRAREIETSM